MKPSLLLATLLAGLGLLAPPPAGAARPLLTGVSGLGAYDAASYAQVEAAGATFVRIPISWAGVAPKQPPASWAPEDPADPSYDWSDPDAAISGAVASGLKPLVLIDGAPRWAERCSSPKYTAGATCDPDPAALAAFATAAARRYSGGFGGLPRVRYWQGLNEPNLAAFFFPVLEGGRMRSPYLIRPLANSFYAAVHGVDPGNVVLLAGLAPVAVPKVGIGPMRFLRALLCMRGRYRFRPAPGSCGGPLRFDVLDIHPYTTGGPTHAGAVDDVELGDLAKLQRLIAAAQDAGRIRGRYRVPPLWVTEFGWDSRPPDAGGLDMPILDRWASEALYRSWKAGVSHFFWFPLADLPPGSPYQGGLYFEEPSPAAQSPKPVLTAFRFPFVAYPRRKGLACWGRTPTGRGGEVRVQVLRGGRWRGVARLRADRHGIFEGLARTAYGRGREGRARAVYRGERSLPFSMRGVADFPQLPFG